MMKNILFLLCLLSMLAAKCPGKRAGNQPFVQLETSPCFGFCPEFRLTVRNNGLTEYEGKRSVVKMGRDSFQLTRAELSGLRDKVKSVNLWQYPDRIPTQVADAPYGTLTVWASGKTKSVSGTIDRPAPLLELEDLMRKLAVAHGIDVNTGVNPNQPPAGARPELLMKLNPSLNAGNFMTQFTEIDLRLVRRVGEENLWVISYDAAQISEKQLLDLLRGLDGVLEAQPNGQASPRN